MKTKNYVSIKIANLLIKGLACAALVVAAETAQAVCSMAQKESLLQDSKDLLAKVTETNQSTGGFIKASYNSNSQASESSVDSKFHKVDRSHPYFKDFNGVGLITIDKFSPDTTRSWGSAVLIGSCYILTNKHVVDGLLKTKNRSLKTGEKFNFSVGQGESCDNQQPFSASNQAVELVDYGRDLEDQSQDNVRNDWALLKLSKPVSNVNPVRVGSLVIRSKKLFQAGYPKTEILEGQKINFSNLVGNAVEIQTRYPDGAIDTNDGKYHPGLSGGAAFQNKSIDGKPSAFLAGLHVGIGNETGQTTGLILSASSIQGQINKSGVVQWEDVVAAKDRCD